MPVFNATQSNFPAATQQPWDIQRAESLAELKLCQEVQTRGKPRPLPLQKGNHSSLYSKWTWLIGSPPFSWPGYWSMVVGDSNRGSWISMMVWALICVTGADMHSCKMTELTCLTRLEGVHVTLEMECCFRNTLNIAASGYEVCVQGARSLRCGYVCCRWCNVLAGKSHFSANALQD